MKIFKNKHKLQKEIFKEKNISFVPTMGGFHKGHISLIKKSKSLGGKTLVSIFVNPKQFNNKYDYINYPRNLKNDLIILKKLKVNYVYLPIDKEIFSFQPKNKIFLHKFSNKLCGKFRKNHFKGVLNVVNRFLELIQPKLIFLGMKDFQQLYLIKKHILKRNIKTKVIACKTIRENNGIACSTRNNNLKQKQILIASQVYKYLLNCKNYPFLNRSKIIKKLKSFGVSKLDYVEFYNIKSFKRKTKKDKNFKIFIAYYLNKIRLIDNI